MFAVTAFTPALGATPSKKAPQQYVEPLVSDDLLRGFREEPGCNGPKLESLQVTLSIEALTASVSLTNHKPDSLERNQVAAQDFNKSAQVAADKGCAAIARKWWLKVVGRSP